jgi:nucleotide-binding universal stress UspA family protein
MPTRAANKTYRDVLEREAAVTARRMGGLLADVAPERVRTAAVAFPSAAHALHTVAEGEHASLVVVGSTHVGTIGRVLPGATGERLLHGAPCAVAIVPEGYRRTDAPIRTIGVAFDESDEAGAALGGAAVMARALDARLEIIGVLPPDPAYGAGELMGGSADPAFREVLRDALYRALDAALATVPEGVDAKRVLLEGDPAERLIAATDGLDVLVMGSRGYGPLRAVIVGAVSWRVAREAHCPVVVTPRGVEAPLHGLFDANDRAAA